MNNGQPLRFAYVGTAGSTSQPFSVFLPGSNNSYTPLSTDFFYLTSMTVTSGYSVAICSSTGITAAQITASTLLLALYPGTGIGFWHEEGSEAVAPPQGIVPSIIDTLDSTNVLVAAGTGYVIHSPGTSVPSWMATK